MAKNGISVNCQTRVIKRYFENSVILRLPENWTLGKKERVHGKRDG